MQETNLTKLDKEFLTIIHNYTQQNGSFPRSRYFENILSISKQGVSNRKSRLTKLGLIKDEELTTKAQSYLEGDSSRAGIIRCHVPTPGDVSAGRRTTGELRVRTNEINDYLEDSYPIPHVSTLNKIVTYRVVGDSMEDEGIFEGDYVLVEVNGPSALSINKIIVTKYLLKGEDSEKDEWRGPTLKVFKGEKTDRNGQHYYALGRKKDAGQHNPNEIEAGSIYPIGVVVGLYRPISE